MQALELAEVTLSRDRGGTPELSITRLELGSGEIMAVTGRADFGKRAFHNVLGGLEAPTSGRVAWNGVDIAALTPARRDLWRARHVGFLSRETHLFPGLSLIDNVLLPAGLNHRRGFGFWNGAADLRQRAIALVERVGLTEPGRPVDGLTREERRRAALARMLLKKPGILLVDDPTGDLGSDAAAAIGDLLLTLAREVGGTLVAFTEDERLVSHAHCVVPLRAGRVLSDGLVEMAS